MSRRRGRPGDAPLLAWGEALRHAQARRRRLARRAFMVAPACALPLLATLFHPAPRLVWNASASEAIGLYRVAPGASVDTGDIVVAWPPAAVRHLAAVRHYLPSGIPLVKSVAAVAGDDVCARGLRLFINSQPAAIRLAQDARLRPMPLWNGCLRLRGRQILLLTASPESFDGRYFGPTGGADVIGRARLLWRR